jgi:hypothetical protein
MSEDELDMENRALEHFADENAALRKQLAAEKIVREKAKREAAEERARSIREALKVFIEEHLILARGWWEANGYDDLTYKPFAATVLSRRLVQHADIEAEEHAAIDEARNKLLVDSLRNLVEKLDAVHADPAYKQVWEISQLHFGPYGGLTYTDELATARTVIALYKE